ncbi:MAG: aldo/keto reductase [Acidobacteriota bacterium]
MEAIELAWTGRVTTRLGYGCSSLMGAVGRRESLALLEAAWDAGVRHFDVAPMYGYGAAEGCVGEFLARHRGEATVTTKFGIPAGKNPGLLRAARRMLRPVLERVPALKKKLARAAASTVAVVEKSQFTADEARASLEHSLRELRVERIDVWLMHEAEASDLGDEGLLRFCEDAVASGKIGAFGVGSERKRIPALMRERPEFCGVLQHDWSVFDETIGATAAFRIHHRSLTENFSGLRETLASDREMRAAWSREIGVNLDDPSVLAHLMLKAALVENPVSLILVSSKKPAHIFDNVRVVGDATLVEPARRLHALAVGVGNPQVAVAV